MVCLLGDSSEQNDELLFSHPPDQQLCPMGFWVRYIVEKDANVIYTRQPRYLQSQTTTMQQARRPDR